MDVALRALAEPNRRRILGALLDREVPAGEIGADLPISRPAVSQHLAVLRAAGLIEERRAGTRRLYRARAEGISELRISLDSFWEGGLARLRDVAEAEAANVAAAQGDGEDDR